MFIVSLDFFRFLFFAAQPFKIAELKVDLLQLIEQPDRIFICPGSAHFLANQKLLLIELKHSLIKTFLSQRSLPVTLERVMQVLHTIDELFVLLDQLGGFSRFLLGLVYKNTKFNLTFGRFELINLVLQLSDSHQLFAVHKDFRFEHKQEVNFHLVVLEVL